jgi:hypothetical protein
MSNKFTSKQAEDLLDSKDIALERLIKLSKLIPEKEDRDDMNRLINEIIEITNKYL